MTDRHASDLPITDEHRVAIVAELVAYQYKHRQIHFESAVYAYEREAKARLEAGAGMGTGGQ